MTGGISLAFHLLAVAFLIGARPGAPGMAANPGGQAGDMNVTLVRASDLALPTESEAATGGLRPLLAKFNSEAAPVAISPTLPPSPMARLLQRIDATTPQRLTLPADRRRDLPADSAARDGTDREAAASGEGEGEAKILAGGGLWGAVEPCWRRLPGSSSVPVTLEVAISRNGDLDTPPKVIRTRDASIDERRLKAEARALTALSACLPRGDVRYGGQAYRLDFPIGGRSAASIASAKQ